MHGANHRKASHSLVVSLTISAQITPNLKFTELKRLQFIQNSLEWTVTRTPKHHHIILIIKSLKWLKIPPQSPVTNQ